MLLLATVPQYIKRYRGMFKMKIKHKIFLTFSTSETKANQTKTKINEKPKERRKIVLARKVFYFVFQ